MLARGQPCLWRARCCFISRLACQARRQNGCSTAGWQQREATGPGAGGGSPAAQHSMPVRRSPCPPKEALFTLHIALWTQFERGWPLFAASSVRCSRSSCWGRTERTGALLCTCAFIKGRRRAPAPSLRVPLLPVGSLAVGVGRPAGRCSLIEHQGAADEPLEAAGARR